jgi:hypothetical protein
LVIGEKMPKNFVSAAFLIFLVVASLSLVGVSQPVKGEQTTQTCSDDFSSDSGMWQYLGCAYRDQANQCLVLTPAGNVNGGAVFFEAPIQGTFTVNFNYKAGGGSYQGDGFTMFFYKEKYTTIGDGGSLGFTPNFQVIPGYGIEFDAWQNIPQDFAQTSGVQQNPQGDPSDHHIALIKGSVGDHLAYVNDQRVADDSWHEVSVNVENSNVKVYVDQGLVLEWNGTLDRTYSGFGFSGGIGGVGSNYHLIDDFSISSRDFQKPSLTTNCLTSASSSNFNVKISGQLSFNGVGIANAPVFLSYSVTGGESWQDLTLVNTDSDGYYSALWLLSVSGNYQLKAVYKGDNNYLGTSDIVNFVIEPCTDQTVFSITSNSTISALTFNSESKELSFNVTGDSGSTGFVNLYIPKSLINDTNGLTVHLDGGQIAFETQSQGDFWLLSFTYHHSTHLVKINLVSTGESNGSGLITELLASYAIYVGIAVAAIIIILVAMLVVVPLRRKRLKISK